MKEEKDILKQVGRRDGMTVPEGYFADFAARMAASLPTTPFEESKEKPETIIKPTLWHRLRPYVYMAAMFAGVWCMLKMFTLLTSTGDRPWEPSPVMAEALGNEIFVNDYILDDVDEWELMEDMVDYGFDLTTLNEPVDITDEAPIENSETTEYNQSI